MHGACFVFENGRVLLFCFFEGLLLTCYLFCYFTWKCFGLALCTMQISVPGSFDNVWYFLRVRLSLSGAGRSTFFDLSNLKVYL